MLGDVSNYLYVIVQDKTVTIKYAILSGKIVARLGMNGIAKSYL